MKVWTLRLFWEKWHRRVSPPTTSTLLQFRWRDRLTWSPGVTSVRTPSCRNHLMGNGGEYFKCLEFWSLLFWIVVVCVFILSKSLNWAWELLATRISKHVLLHLPSAPLRLYWGPCMLLGTFCHLTFVRSHSWLKCFCGHFDRCHYLKRIFLSSCGFLFCQDLVI